jgi:hypothetical protein
MLVLQKLTDLPPDFARLAAESTILMERVKN